MTTRKLSMHRPAQILKGQDALDEEMRAARYLHHRLLDFETEHQKVIDAAAEAAAPGIVRVGVLVSRLARRAKRRERTIKGSWSPNPHPAWLAALKRLVLLLKARRNVDPAWKDALKWADTPEPDAPSRGNARRKPGEDDAQFAVRVASRRNTLTRREAWRKRLYDAHVAGGATERSRVYWGTWNALLASVDQARAMVIEARSAGAAAEWRRPRRDGRSTIAADRGGFRVLERGSPWWTVEIRTASSWVRFRAKCGNWHEIPASAQLRTCKLTRDGGRYSVSFSVDGMPDELTYSVDGRREMLDGRGVVALDWGHREHGHDTAHLGMRVFTWRGNDGASGEVLLPKSCRESLDLVNALKSRVDLAFKARKVPERNRFRYRARLMRAGVRTSEEALWLAWETRYEKRIDRARRRAENLREETYLRAVRALRQCYETFAFEDLSFQKLRADQKSKQMAHRKRQNRELSAPYEFQQICERLGATLIGVDARNSSRECPECGKVSDIGSDCYAVCPACGVVRDRDHGAARVLLGRALAKIEESAGQAA